MVKLQKQSKSQLILGSKSHGTRKIQVAGHGTVPADAVHHPRPAQDAPLAGNLHEHALFQRPFLRIGMCADITDGHRGMPSFEGWLEITVMNHARLARSCGEEQKASMVYSSNSVVVN